MRTPRTGDLVPSRAGTALSVLAALLALAAALAGLSSPGLYRDAAWLVPQARGQDLVTAAAAVALLAMASRARRGSARAAVARLGLLGYLVYTFTGAAFAYAFNALFLVYVAAFSASVFALVAVASRLDAHAVATRFDDRTPRQAVAAFLLAVAVLLSALWLGQLVPALASGGAPDAVVRSGGSIKYVYALDLGLVVPLSLAAAWWVWRRAPWGFVLAGIVLVKALTMGLALLAMTWFSLSSGAPLEPGLFLPWLMLAAGSLGVTWWYLAHCRPLADASGT